MYREQRLISLFYLFYFKGDVIMKFNFRKCLQVILISSLSISCWEIGKKQKGYLESRMEHRNVIKEKEKIINFQKLSVLMLI